MIYIKRDEENPPEILTLRKDKIEQQILKAHERTMSDKRLFSMPFRSFIRRECKDAAMKQFNNKCAYCETLTDPETSSIDEFRPWSRARGIRGEIYGGYYWLVFEWSNMYNSCLECNRHKSTRFPVTGRRAKYRQTDTSKEDAHLLNPCKIDDWKVRHFKFDISGELHPLTTKGKTTIEILALNRISLVGERKKIINNYEKIRRFVKPTKTKTNKSRLEYLLENLQSQKSHLALRRYLTAEMLQPRWEEYQELFPEITNKIELQLAGEWEFIKKSEKGVKVLRKVAREVKSDFDYSFITQKNYDIESLGDKESPDYFTGAKLISKIYIENFKGIKKMELEFPKPEKSSEGESWMVLIGRNSTGKSTILQAIALTLIGQKQLDSMENMLDARKFVRDAQGISKGHIKIWFSNFLEPIELHFDKSNSRFESNIIRGKVMILAYGSTRILPIKSSSIIESHEFIPTNILNLFDPQNQLRSVEQWLGDLDIVSSPQFKEIKNALFDLLDFSIAEREVADIFRFKGKVRVKLPDGTYSIRELCDGYQSVIAYTLDIMITLFEKWSSIQDAEGVVLIDEIGVHLHPSWKIRIIDLLRKVFPRVTFVVTTHDPLCLRSARKGEVHILSRDAKNYQIKYEQVDIPPGTPVDRLYTGLWFSLESTLDMETSQLMAEHRHLVFENQNQNRSRIKELESEIGKRLQHSTDGSLFGEFVKVFDEVLEVDEDIDEDELKSMMKAKLKKKFKKTKD